MWCYLVEEEDEGVHPPSHMVVAALLRSGWPLGLGEEAVWLEVGMLPVRCLEGLIEKHSQEQMLENKERFS
jgi:hypothetical protein